MMHSKWEGKEIRIKSKVAPVFLAQVKGRLQRANNIMVIITITIAFKKNN